MANTQASTAAPPRLQGKKRPTPINTGTPDWRPLTDYAIDFEVDGADLNVTIKLDQPCVIREPAWQLVSCVDGSVIKPATLNITDSVKFHLSFKSAAAATYNFLEVPCQDTQVQNFLGGFVVPGARWFRAPS